MAKSDRLPTLVQQYDLNVSSGVAPPPYPRHVKKQSEVVSQDLQCVLYRILAVKNGNFSVGDVVNPAGHSSSIHDFSDAFHLAAAVSAIGCCYPLTAFEEANLIQSYAAQLISMGLWEWAAYVFLCFFSELSPNALQWRKLQAKKVILQHFNDEDSSSSDRRSFLEQKVGVPTEWFEEALADRCVSNNAYAYVKHLSAFSPERARIAFEALLLPNLLFADIGQSLKLLEVFGTEHGTLSSAVLDFYRLSEEVSRLAQAKECDRKEYIPILLGKATSVQSSLASYRSQTGLNSCGTGLPMYPGFKVVSRDSFLAEALAGISFLHLQMRALESGISIFQDSGMKFASQLAFLSNSDVLEDNTCSTNESILRGLI